MAVNVDETGLIEYLKNLGDETAMRYAKDLEDRQHGLSRLEPQISVTPPITKRLDQKLKEMSPILRQEWERQTANMTRLGFHQTLKMTESEYLLTLPDFPPQPPEYQGVLDIPLIVETRIKLHDILRLARIPEIYSEGSVSDQSSKFKPCAIWTHDGSRYLNQPVEEAEKHLLPLEDKANLRTAICLRIQYPHLFENYGFDAPASSWEHDFHLGNWEGGRVGISIRGVEYSHAVRSEGVEETGAWNNLGETMVLLTRGKQIASGT